MNTLVGLGAVSSFAVSTAAALLPKLVYFLCCSFSFQFVDDELDLVCVVSYVLAFNLLFFESFS